MLRYILAWIPMVFLAILNGMMREVIFAKKLSELRAHQLSCLTGILIFAVYTWIINSLWPMQSTEQALTIGVMWLFLTILFEFSFGHYVAHHSWRKLLEDYNILAGRLWILVLGAVFALPAIMFLATR